MRAAELMWNGGIGGSMTYSLEARLGVALRFFFFSSRRRHTRFKCDWSSDVCSSDLPSATSRCRCAPLWKIYAEHTGIDSSLMVDTVRKEYEEEQTKARALRKIPHLRKIGRASCRERV